jgi:hypothetical protein
MDRRLVVLVGLLSVGGFGCRRADPGGGGASPAAEDGWSVTAWGERYEVFAETGPLVAGSMATSNAHVTVLSGFAPLKEGAVTVILRAPDGSVAAFRQTQPKRDGIYPVEMKPGAEGVFDLVFRIESSAGPEDVEAGRVRVGSTASPGGGDGAGHGLLRVEATGEAELERARAGLGSLERGSPPRAEAWRRRRPAPGRGR